MDWLISNARISHYPSTQYLEMQTFLEKLREMLGGLSFGTPFFAKIIRTGFGQKNHCRLTNEAGKHETITREYLMAQIGTGIGNVGSNWADLRPMKQQPQNTPPVFSFS